jgi:hypothetical protein
VVTRRARTALRRHDLAPNGVAPYAESMESRRALILSVSFSARMQKCPGSPSICNRRHDYSASVKLHAWWFSTIWFGTADFVAHRMVSTVRRSAETFDERPVLLPVVKYATGGHVSP